MDERPSALFYVVAFTALSLLVAGLVLSVQNDDAAIAGAATGVGAVGFLACAAMLKHLRACEDKDKFPRFLPPGTKIAFKTGSVEASRTAAGIIECGQGPVALCVLTDGNADHRLVADNAGNRLCADIARAVFDHFGPEVSPERVPAAGNEAKKE